MSSSADSDFNLGLHFLPDWAKETDSIKRFSHIRGDESTDGSRGRDRDRRGGGGGGRPSGGGFRPDGGRPRPAGGTGRPRGDGRDRGPGGPRGNDRRSGPSPEENRSEPPAPPEVDIQIIPDEKGVDSLSKQIKLTGRAYPIFEIAQMILQKPERHGFRYQVIKDAQGQVKQPLFACALDDSLWLSQEEAARHILDKHFDTFYQTDKIASDAPKGTYTFVAQCGMSGEILGPPNYHAYQSELRRVHTEKFARLPFEAFKARVRIVKDEEVVKKWLESQSFKTEFTALNVAEPLKFQSRDEVEKHFRAVHLETLVKQVTDQQISGTQLRGLPPTGLVRLARRTLEDQRRFPLKVVNSLSHQFAARGLQFFKVNKSVIHVAAARPHFLDMAATPVSDGVRKIVEFISAHPQTNRKAVVEGLLQAEGKTLQTEVTTETPADPMTTAIISDLHWLIHEGHVIEFASGTLETAKRPNPKPASTPKKERPLPAIPKAKKSESASVAETAPTLATPDPKPESLPASGEVETKPEA